jgi:hypothetical protein
MNNEEFKPGIVHLPYITKVISTSINGTTVWHSNKFINLWLKIKFFFCKPKSLKKFETYANKKVSAKYYELIKIEENDYKD